MRKAITYIANRFRRYNPEMSELVEKVNSLSFRYEEPEKKTSAEDDDLPF